MSLSLPQHGERRGQPKYVQNTTAGHDLYRKLAGEFGNFFKPGGGGLTGLSQPMGVWGPIWQNLFGQNPTDDYLGARGALQDTLSGKGLDTALMSATNQLLPSTLKGISEGSSALRSAAGPLGLRFSSDLAGQQENLSKDLLSNMSQQALGAGTNIYNQRARSAQDIFNLVAQYGQQNNPLAVLMAFLGLGGAAPQLGNFGGGGGGGGVSAGLGGAAEPVALKLLG